MIPKIRIDDPVSGQIIHNTLNRMGLQCNGPIFAQLGHCIQYYVQHPSAKVNPISSTFAGWGHTVTTTIFDFMEAYSKERRL